MEKLPFDSTTEYRTSFTWRNKPKEASYDPYEDIVDRMMQTQFISNSPTKHIEEDPYELIVQRKMNEMFQEEEKPQSQHSDADSFHSNGRHSHSHSRSNSRGHSREQSREHSRVNSRSQSRTQNRKDFDNNSVCSKSSSRSNHSAHSNKVVETNYNNFQENMSYSSNSEEPVYMQKPQQPTIVIQKKYDASHLNKKQRVETKTEYTGNVRPVFFRNPEHASEKEKKHLYGPFFVSWPKNKAMPVEYAELQKVYNKHHY
ncbi:hypothetical protein TRFO_17294 [Tritrichomonas foetus]|uniref:Uncharacterized protein n=1 Tax=Tritrichomonas foetus TaxID=1144522 RepID=A0A1J4KN55_9EUKA|nr:hypothetical protein TRFO_17294 [Tritrichomonas foetus]|eukprot:OHT12751.1 hypothetical protein TRFO_17294 [Tritrichomonas foetus]